VVGAECVSLGGRELPPHKVIFPVQRSALSFLVLDHWIHSVLRSQSKNRYNQISLCSHRENRYNHSSLRSQSKNRYSHVSLRSKQKISLDHRFVVFVTRSQLRCTDVHPLRLLHSQVHFVTDEESLKRALVALHPVSRSTIFKDYPEEESIGIMKS
jgi:hypothetical protein